MAIYTNPDDVILKPKPKQPDPLIDPTLLREALKEEPKGIMKAKSWWDSLRIKPFISFSRGPEAPGGKSVLFGIKGTF